MEKLNRAISLIEDTIYESERVIEEFCIGYCKYPKEFKDRYDNSVEAANYLIVQKCMQCPVNKFLGGA